MAARPRDRILRRLDSRFTFVVGKGGVGKTTTAGALAVAFSDSGRSTHLISTDPAHSLGDLFDASFSTSSLRRGACGTDLTLEEFDAKAYAAGWIREATDPISEIFDRGTYLDREDISAFLDLSLPGLDEVMAALRLAELADEPAERIVVDTAPTGHTLRLLDSGRMLATWVTALRAMADKAAVVASHLTQRQVRLTAERFVENFAGRIGRFERDVLAQAAFVVVSRPGAVVRAETKRLVQALSVRGLRVVAQVQTGGEAKPGRSERIAIPLQLELKGCQELRRWGLTPRRRAVRAVVGRAARRAAQPYPQKPNLASVLARQVLLFAGKGGVGKSTCAAACALALAEAGPTDLLSTDPAGSLEDLFGVRIAAGGTKVGSQLTLRQLDAEREFTAFRSRYRDEVAHVFARLGLERSAALDRRVVESLLNLAPPGIDEIFALSVMLEITGQGRTLVLDSSPTGHFLRLVAMPDIASDWTRALMRILIKYRAVLGLDDVAEGILHFARNVKSLSSLLRDPARTAVVIVTEAEAMVVAESRRLAEQLARAGMPVAVRIHNRSTRATPSPGPPARIRAESASGPLPLDVVAFVSKQPLVGVERLRAFFDHWEVRV